MGTVHIRRSTLASPEAARLIAALNAELTKTFPEPGATHFSLSDKQVVAGDGAFLVAYLDDMAVGCGAVRRLDEATAEIKRMYVDPSVRDKAVRGMEYAHIPLFGEYTSHRRTRACVSINHSREQITPQ